MPHDGPWLVAKLERRPSAVAHPNCLGSNAVVEERQRYTCASPITHGGFSAAHNLWEENCGLRRHVRELKRVIAQSEWCVVYKGVEMCPACDGSKPRHRDGCKLDEALKS